MNEPTQLERIVEKAAPTDSTPQTSRKKPKKPFLHRACHGAYRTMKGAAVASVLGFTAMVANYYATHDNVRIKQAQGAAEYAHPDRQTTHILNYLTGKEPLSRNERLRLLISFGEELCKVMHIESPDFSHMNERQFVAWMLHTTPGGKEDTVDSALKDLDVMIPLQRPHNPELYTTLWKMEMDVGAPYVRWSTGRENQERGLGTIVSDTTKYNPFSNTVRMHPFSGPLETLIAEFSHARQFNGSPFTSYMRGAESVLRTIARAVFERRSLGDAYHQEYATPGSLEYEAHKIIEPRLKRGVIGRALTSDIERTVNGD